MTENAGAERVLITGVTGFIGSRVAARRLQGAGEVRGLVRRAAVIPGVETVVGDMLDDASLERAVAGIDVVIHTAVDEGDDPDRARKVNEGGTRALARAALAAGCRRFVHLSTCAVYALEGLDLVTEATKLWPEERAVDVLYGATKAMAERALSEVASAGLDVVILRPPNVLGAHPRSIFTDELATRVRDGAIGYALDGTNTWPYVHVENLVDAIEAAVQRPIAAGRAYTVVDGHTTWRAFLETYAGWFGVEIGQREPRSLYDHFHGHFTTDRVRTELGYAPRRSLDDAMHEIRRYLEERGVVPSGAPSANQAEIQQEP